MTFLTLYDDALDTELASSDLTQLFTSARRKKAINDAQREFVRQTGCCIKYGSIPIVDGTSEYDLGSNFDDFANLVAQESPSIKIVDGDGNVRYIQGDVDFPMRTPADLDAIDPGWRAADAGTPIAWYTREDAGVLNLGAYPAPDVGTDDTWSWLVPYVFLPADMSSDTDQPFSSGTTLKFPRLVPYHQALVHYAAAMLEPLRKNYAAVERQMNLYSGWVARYLEDMRSRGSDQIRTMRPYLGESLRSRRPLDPRRYP